MPEASTSASATGTLADSPLGDLLSWRSRPADIGASEQTQDLLQLLKQLEALNRHGQTASLPFPSVIYTLLGNFGCFIYAVKWQHHPANLLVQSVPIDSVTSMAEM